MVAVDISVVELDPLAHVAVDVLGVVTEFVTYKQVAVTADFVVT